jgi:hypothetical protein
LGKSGAHFLVGDVPDVTLVRAYLCHLLVEIVGLDGKNFFKDLGKGGVYLLLLSLTDGADLVRSECGVGSGNVGEAGVVVGEGGSGGLAGVGGEIFAHFEVDMRV